MWRKQISAVLLVAALASACSEAKPGLEVQKIPLDIAFGFRPEGPANFGPELPPQPDLADLADLPELPDLLPPTAAVKECPRAAINSFPAQEATLDAPDPPGKGVYRWKVDGKVSILGLPELPVTGFETRQIRSIQRVSKTKFTFQTVQTDLYGLEVVTTWTVNNAPIQQDVNPGTGTSARVGEPERGIVLSKVERFNDEGTMVSSFDPVPDVLYLPLPVQPGEIWESQGVDPLSGQVLRHSGTVMGRRRVDACGDVVDGWEVKGSQVFVGTAPSEREYNYVIASQLGGILIREHINSVTADGSLDATYSLGQLEPSRLPKGGG